MECNGLSSLAKRAQVKEMVKRCKTSLVCLQETKLEVINKVTVRSIGLRGQWSFSFVGSIGLSGGILVAWEESYWKVAQEWKGRFSLSVVLERVEDVVRVVFSGVYGPSLRVEKRLESWGTPPFRFEIAWLQDSNMEERLGKWWASENFEGPADKELLESRIADLGALEEEGLGNMVSREKLGHFREEHKSILLHEEIFWRQNSTVKWLKEGDKNTAYFHAIASVRRRGNRIVSLMVDEEVVSGKEEISSAILSFYNAIYTSDGISKPIPDGVDFNHLECDQSRKLEDPLRIKEIERAAFSLGRDKAPGPNGFRLAFF
ncbi:uncharacterized protein LOC143881285 [Tasmannia lanceolata]|uniref:uncharacterized protein LOC143881285 n=1 Tax=Tasmannia lanceolata TaxID=3420 RepID=UPI0040635E99